MRRLENLTNEEIAHVINTLPAKDKALLKLIFVENIPLTTLMWIYQLRYANMKARIKEVLDKLKA